MSRTSPVGKHRTPYDYPSDLPPAGPGTRYVRIRWRNCRSAFRCSCCSSFPWRRFQVPAGFIGRAGRA